jgi:peptidoglycan/xylan/chitin deacetylase (PgdA/CDA1 family)
MIIWRDDDILWGGDSQSSAGPLSRLAQVDDLFQKYGLTHTVAVLASTLTPDVVALVKERRMDVQLHAWKHDDLSVDAKARGELPMAVKRIEDLFGITPTTLYPPWNRVSRPLRNAARALGLTVSHEKVSLGSYLEYAHVHSDLVINFHYWADEVESLEPAMQLHARLLAEGVIE